MRIKPLLFIVCALALVARGLSAQGTRVLPFQGRLTDAQGQPIPDGTKLIQFQIYGDPVGGNALWAGEVHRTTVNGGLVNVLLGSKNPLPNDRPDNPSLSFFDGTLYLQITVDTSGPSGVADGQITAADPPLLPRQAILPLIFASESALSRNSQKLNGFDWSALLLSGGNSNNPVIGQIDGNKIGPGTLPANRLAAASITGLQIASNAISGDQIMPGTITSNQILSGTVDLSKLAQTVADFLVPVGTIIAFAGPSTKIPDGWFLCDGTLVSRAKYLNLFNAIDVAWGKGDGSTTFSVPDLQGFFLRGMDYGTGRDPDRLSRYYQPNGGGTYSGVGSYQQGQIIAHNHAFRRGITPAFGSEGIAIAPGSTIDSLSSAATDKIVTAGGSETRPINAYVNYIIKY